MSATSVALPPASSTPSPIQLWDIHRTSASLWKQHAALCIGGGALLWGLPRLLILHAQTNLAPDANPTYAGLLAAASEATWILSTVWLGVLTHGAMKSLVGRGATREALAALTARSLLSQVVATWLTMFAGVLGIIAFIVPGLVVLLAASVAGPAALIEHLGPLAALRRSDELTRGHKWKLLLLWSVLAGNMVALGLAGKALLALATMSLAEDHAALCTSLVVEAIGVPALTTFATIMCTVVFDRLRRAHDAREALTRAFT